MYPANADGNGHSNKEYAVDAEKNNHGLTGHHEDTGSSPGRTTPVADGAGPHADYPGKGSALEKRLLRRIDLRLIPPLGKL